MATKLDIPRILSEMTGQDPADITAATRLAEDLHIKSANRMELTVRIEDQLGVSLTVFEVLKAKTVADVVALVEGKSTGPTKATV